jgi:DMSO/TMAO reductase YedYZ molybdopterin-dependent catalytic subunit
MTTENPAKRLPPNQQLVAPGKWPTVGESRPRLDAEPWRVSVRGLVAQPRSWTLAELATLSTVERVVDIHCVTRWSRLGARFGGVPLRVLLEQCQPLAGGRFVSFIARSERGHSTSLPVADALALDTLIALSYEGRPLEEVHGGPVRTIVPERYFYKSLKWLETIEVLAEDRLGYWESETGYHNTGDPWREERYLAANLDRLTVREVLSRRDFSGRDLRGLVAEGLDLAGLDARGAALRDANFRGANLAGACFDGANLSNAHLEGANLQGAGFLGADVEGADFRGADLRQADFRGASLFGVTLCPDPHSLGGWGPATLDRTTRIDPAVLDKLTPIQADYARRMLERQ